MNSLIEALRSGSKDHTGHLGKVKELRSALIEVGLPEDEQTIISTAKILWNEAVMHDATETLNKSTAQFLAACREVALLAMQKYIHPPWDDKMLLTFFEMCIRVGRAFSKIGENSLARLYISKATDIKEDFEENVLLAPSIKLQFEEAICLYYAERFRHELHHGELEDLIFQHLNDGLGDISKPQLPMFVTDIVEASSQTNGKDDMVRRVLERLLDKIKPIDTFPAHVCEDLVALLTDILLKKGRISDLKAAEELLTNINPNSTIAQLGTFKYMLVGRNGSMEDLITALIKCCHSGKSLLDLMRMISEARGPEYFLQCVEQLHRIDPKTLNQEAKAELIELTVEAHLTNMKPITELIDYLASNLMHLKNTQSRLRLKKLLVQRGEAEYISGSFKLSYDLFTAGSMLFQDDCQIDKLNKSKITRKMIMCMLELDLLVEAEDMILSLPNDLNGAFLRFQLAACRKNSADASAHLERMAVSEGITIDYLLGLANFCTKRCLNDILLMVLQRAYLFCEQNKIELNVQIDILQSIMSIIYKLSNVSVQVRINLTSQYLEKIQNLFWQTHFSSENLQFFFKIGWNSAIEACEAKMFDQACLLSYFNYMLIKSISESHMERLKLATLINCLANFFKVKNPDRVIPLSHLGSKVVQLFMEARSIFDDLQITSAYLPKRDKKVCAFSTEIDSAFDFDPLYLSRTLDILEFQVRSFENSLEQMGEFLNKLKLSCQMKDIEQLTIWCLSQDLVPTELLLGVLQIFCDKVIADPNSKDVDFVKFSFIYRGMAIISLRSSPFEKKGKAFEYFKQALEIVKVFPEYPKDEICWLAVASYNYALGISMLDIESAHAWSELSLSFCNHMGHHKEAYESTIRNGYSKILQRLSSIHNSR